MKMQRGFYFDQTRCTGCQACGVACKDWHDRPAGPSRWIRIGTSEQGAFPHPSVSFLFRTCYHCADPACVPACPHRAIMKREQDGIVVVKGERCVGREKCGMCREACPYEAPQFPPEPEAPMEKCDFCLERWEEGNRPVCVDSCPARALDAGSLEDLVKKHGNRHDAVGFAYVTTMNPSIVFKPKKRRNP